MFDCFPSKRLMLWCCKFCSDERQIFAKYKTIFLTISNSELPLRCGTSANAAWFYDVIMFFRDVQVPWTIAYSSWMKTNLHSAAHTKSINNLTMPGLLEGIKLQSHEDITNLRWCVATQKMSAICNLKSMKGNAF